MEREGSKQVSLFMWVLVAGLLSQNFVIPVTSTGFEEQKNYYPAPDPHTGTPPSGSHGTPSHGSGGSYGGSPPSHGTPSHGGGYHPTPTPTPSTPSYGGSPPSHGTPSHGGGYHPTPTPTPSTPSGGNCGTPPHEPSTPSRPSHTPSHGGYYHSPPTSGGGSPPTPVTVSPPTTPISPPSYGGGSPPTPVIVSPPTTPIIDPGTPSIPTPPFFPAPTSPFGGTCDFWRSHPTLIWGVLGWLGTVGNAFGVPSMPGFGAHMSLPQALSNTRTDGLGALYREGTASLLNSMVNNRFPFSTKQVRDSFVAALGSNSAAAAQARLFKLANEGHLKPRA
ncbi:hypothetical protein REPUB_Repub09cG0067600 [Reevesia pubescens]